jgi:D-alanine-D-alanine ligase
MPQLPTIALLCGGTSSEREVSLGSGAACAKALAGHFAVETFDVKTDALPPGLSREKHVVFSTLHGSFGEDGGMQRLLDRAGIHYAGCDAVSSELTMDKTRTKIAVSAKGIQVAPGVLFAAAHKPATAAVIDQLGESVVVKPNDQGSSVGLTLVSDRAGLHEALERITTGNWLIEQRIAGRELSVGVLDGRALGVVEIRPKSGVYDFASKYTKGMTEYFAPAPLDEKETEAARSAAEISYAACGCRDYARVDFIFAPGGLFLLEINTLPGMKETSLLPMSARCAGLDFSALVKEMIAPALRRFHADQALLPT